MNKIIYETFSNRHGKGKIRINLRKLLFEFKYDGSNYRKDIMYNNVKCIKSCIKTQKVKNATIKLNIKDPVKDILKYIDEKALIRDI